MKNERGFLGLLSLLISLAIIGYLAILFLKIFTSRQVFPQLEAAGNISQTAPGAGPVSVLQNVRERVSAYNQAAAARVNSLLNTSDPE